MIKGDKRAARSEWDRECEENYWIKKEECMAKGKRREKLIFEGKTKDL